MLSTVAVGKVTPGAANGGVLGDPVDLGAVGPEQQEADQRGDAGDRQRPTSSASRGPRGTSRSLGTVAARAVRPVRVSGAHGDILPDRQTPCAPEATTATMAGADDQPVARLRGGERPLHPGPGAEPALHDRPRPDRRPPRRAALGRSATRSASPPRSSWWPSGSAPSWPRAPQAYTVLKIAGAAYVVWLGIQAIRHRADARAALDAVDHRRGRPRPRPPLAADRLHRRPDQPEDDRLLRGLPAAVRQRAGRAHRRSSSPCSALVFGAMAVVSDRVWALAASKARDWFARRPQRLDTLGVAGGVMMIGLGADHGGRVGVVAAYVPRWRRVS